MDYALELLMLAWNEEYPTLQKERETDEEAARFSETQKKMNGLLEGIVLIYTANKNTRR